MDNEKKKQIFKIFAYIDDNEDRYAPFVGLFFDVADRLEEMFIDMEMPAERASIYRHTIEALRVAILGRLNPGDDNNSPQRFDYYCEKFRKLRHEVFLRDGEICAKCKITPKPGVSLTIDHIKPVSKYPDLSLDIDNLQVLCWPCNQGKSNKHETDYR